MKTVIFSACILVVLASMTLALLRNDNFNNYRDTGSVNAGRRTCYRSIRNGMSSDRQCVGYGGRCYITDELSGRGYCIQSRRCGYNTSRWNRNRNVDECPIGYRCDYTRRYCVPELV